LPCCTGSPVSLFYRIEWDVPLSVQGIATAVEQAIGKHLDGTPLENPNAGKNPAAVALRSLGGAKGGKARAAKLSPAKAKGDRHESGAISLEQIITLCRCRFDLLRMVAPEFPRSVGPMCLVC
jgi:hypothetical protein